MVKGLEPLTRVASAAADFPGYYASRFSTLIGDGSDQTSAFQAVLDSLPTDSTLWIPRGFDIGLSAQIDMLGRRNIAIVSETRVANFGGGAPPTFTWLGTGGKMFNMDSCQGCTIQGFLLRLASEKTIDKFIDIDGAGVSGTISTANTIRYNSLNASNQSVSGFIAISIAATSQTNNEFMVVEENVIICSDGSVRYVDDGAINASDATLTSATANFIAGDVGKRIRVGRAGLGGVTLDTTILSRTSSTEVELATNASVTVTGARIHIGEVVGTGIKNGNSPNALHQRFFNNNIQSAAKAIDIRNGSALIDGLTGGLNEIDVLIGQSIGEGTHVYRHMTEGSRQGLVHNDVPAAPTIINHHRTANDAQLTEGFYSFEGSVVFKQGLITKPPPEGGAVFKDAGISNLRLLSQSNDWRTAIQNSINFKNAGFGNLGASRTWISKFDRGIAGFPEQGIVFSGSMDEQILGYGLATSNNHILTGFGTIKESGILPSSGSAALTPATTKDTQLIGDDIEIFGAPRPNIPHATRIGSHSGSSTYQFSVVAVDALGNRSLRSFPSRTLFNVHATLSASIFVRVIWPQVPNASTYELYRSNPSNPTGEGVLVASGIATNSYDVIANPSTSYVAWDTLTPARNESTGIKFRARVIHPDEVVFPANDTSPSVAKANDFVTANSSATTVSTFDDPLLGQLIRVRVNDANTTFAHGAGIITRTGANVVATNGLIYQFIRRGSDWYQL